MKNKTTILAIETSCDDTCIAVLEIETGKTPRFNVLSNIISSQIEIHKKYGGVYPTMAKREHQRNLPAVLIKALQQSKLLKISKSKILNPKQIQNSKFKILNSILKREPQLLKVLIKFLKTYKKPRVDAIAVTVGPGLEPCLWVGVNFARALSYYWGIPIIPVNHIEGHILVNFIDKQKTENRKQISPAMCLVVSGGHTQLILMEKIGKYRILGETRDDAAGECFDKTARILGLGYPGGPAIARTATKAFGCSTSQYLPRPMINSKNYDFSFAGLKTAVLYQYQKSKIKNQNYKRAMAKEIQQAIIDVLIKKTIKAAKQFGAKTIILGGGVTANDELRKQFSYKLQVIGYKLNFLVPPKNLCTDNATMAAVAGYFNQNKKIKNWRKIKAEANLKIKSSKS